MCNFNIIQKLLFKKNFTFFISQNMFVIVGSASLALQKILEISLDIYSKYCMCKITLA